MCKIIKLKSNKLKSWSKTSTVYNTDKNKFSSLLILPMFNYLLFSYLSLCYLLLYFFNT